MSKYTLSEYLQQIECSRSAIDQAEQMESEIDRLTRELAEAKARALPDGWVAVPREPDEWMTQAAINYIMCHMITMRNVKTALALAIAARPESPKESENE